MNLSQIKAVKLSRKKPTRIGRGSASGQGCTAGKGMKGQNCRSGITNPIVFEGGTMPLYRRLPKRGFSRGLFEKIWLPVNIEDLNCFKDGDKVDIEVLKKEGLVKCAKSKSNIRIKLLGKGTLKVKDLKVTVHKISKTAREQIEKNNGTVKLIKFSKPRRKS